MREIHNLIKRPAIMSASGRAGLNFLFPHPVPAICPGVHGDAFQAYDNAQKIKAMQGTIIPVHDVCVGKMKF